jgi:hypothetical protein
MQMRSFGSLGEVSALTLGGGGIGNVWGAVERAEAIATVRAALDVGLFREVVRPAFERLKEEGTIGGWGLTAVGHPSALADVLSDDVLPAAVQCVANALDLSGDMWVFGPDERPDNAGVRNRAELEECLAAEAAGPLAPDELAAIDALRGS